MITQDGAEVVTGGASLPATPAAALLDAAHPDEIVVLGVAGAGTSITKSDLAQLLVAPTLALRRKAAVASTALLWECNEAASPLASTGSVACSLANAGAAVFNFIDPVSTLDGGAAHFTGGATSEVSGGAGVYPSGSTTTSVTMWAVINIHTMPAVAGCVIARDYGATWVSPFGAFVDILPSGVVRAFAPFGGGPTEDTVSSSAGAVVINRQHLVGMTYDGSRLRVWVDGVLVANKAVASPLAWGAVGPWHLGANGGGNLFSGVVIRAGVETTVWTRADWALAYRRLVGTTSNV
jgi:hypothetical protein